MNEILTAMVITILAMPAGFVAAYTAAFFARLVVHLLR